MGRKLFVQIGNASHLLPPKDSDGGEGGGGGAVYCLIDYDGQRHRTEEMKPKEAWNSASTVSFNVTDPHSMDAHVLEISVYSVNGASSHRFSGFLGRVRIRGSSFSRDAEGPLIYYKLRRKGWSLWSVKGEIGLRVWWIDEPESSSSRAPEPEEPVAAQSENVRFPAEHRREPEPEPEPDVKSVPVPPAVFVEIPQAAPAAPVAPAAPPTVQVTPPAAPTTPPAAPTTPPAAPKTVPAAAAVPPAKAAVPVIVIHKRAASGCSHEEEESSDEICSCIYGCSSSCSCSSSDSDHEHEDWPPYERLCGMLISRLEPPGTDRRTLLV